MKWESCCRGRRSACPEVAIDGRKVYVKDDEGHIICVTLDQFTDIHYKLKELACRRLPKINGRNV